MSVNILSDKENFRKFINHLRKYVKDDDSYKIYNIYDIVMRYHYRTCYDQGSTLFVHIFKFDDEFEISVSDDELKSIIIILFNEVDLMSQNTEVEIKKEEDICFKNIWHFNPDLAEYLPNGEIKRLQTMINHFNEEGLKIFEKTHETLDIIPALRDKCSYTKKEYETLFIYKFDNGIQFSLNDDDLETIAIVIVDAY